MSGKHVRRFAAVVAAAAVAVLGSAMPAGAVVQHDAIEATGSSWSGNALTQWVSDVSPLGVRVSWTAPGSAQGRKDFATYTNDMGVSDIGYQGSDPQTGAADTSPRPYAYLPIVAGGTAFPYQIRQGGKLIQNLRLSGETVAKIFTGQIRNWNHPQITRDNNGRVLPSKTIVPVVHSEGAGSTAQFTQYLADQYPAIWRTLESNGRFTEYYPPAPPGVTFIAQSGSDGVMNYVGSGAGDGTIGYDEYSYPLNAGFPVAKVLNRYGNFTKPTQFNVAVALTQASINLDKTSTDYLLQKLHDVYVYADPRTYPLSSYSYAIIPTAADDRRMNKTYKRQTIADFLFYAVCGGQAELGANGYSSLPLNLVKRSFEQVAKLKQADPTVDISKQQPSSCDNPTFDPRNPDKNLLAETAPGVPACDHVGQGPCVGQGDNGTGRTGAGGSGASGGSGGGASQNGGAGAGQGGAAQAQPGGSTAARNGTTSARPRAGASTAATRKTSSAAVDPETGQAIDAAAGDSSGDVAANPTELKAYQRSGSDTGFAFLAVVLLVAAILLPPVLVQVLNRRNGQ